MKFSHFTYTCAYASITQVNMLLVFSYTQGTKLAHSLLELMSRTCTFN